MGDAGEEEEDVYSYQSGSRVPCPGRGGMERFDGGWGRESHVRHMMEEGRGMGKDGRQEREGGTV